MISAGQGNLLDADADALVNTVNTVGVMGKGIALQFKRAFPAMFDEYERAAKKGLIHLGQVQVWPTQQLSGPRFIVNFPTKGHWRAKSRLTDIERGLDDLVQVIRMNEIRSIAIPPLGCGHGGLDWAVVEPLILSKLEPLDDVDILIFAPGAPPAAAEMKVGGVAPPMTPGRAALIELMESYATHALAYPSLIETQKLMYFLQEAGEPLRLHFEAHHYGPYADNLRHVLSAIEGYFLSGYGDGSRAIEDAESLVVLPGSRESAQPVLAEHPETTHRISRVLDLLEGFESAYSLELLATVHWIIRHDADAATNQDKAVLAVRSWSPRKQRMFTADHIRVAWDRLMQTGWAGALAGAG